MTKKRSDPLPGGLIISDSDSEEEGGADMVARSPSSWTLTVIWTTTVENLLITYGKMSDCRLGIMFLMVDHSCVVFAAL